ncbi:hypothetical protein DFAR_750013 [Desulfarculales bacterium]
MPTRATPRECPSTSGGSLILAMVSTTPKTATTMPRAGRPSATLATAAENTIVPLCWISMSISIRSSRLSSSMPTDPREVGHSFHVAQLFTTAVDKVRKAKAK